MSHLRTGGLGIRKLGGVFAALLVFQVLAVVGAGSALAVVTCNYNAATNVVDIRLDPGDDVEVYVTTVADGVGGGQIRTYDPVNNVMSDCGAATVDNTDLVTVEGSGVSQDNDVEIQNSITGAATGTGPIITSPGGAQLFCCGDFTDATAFAVDLGENAGDDDEFSYQGRPDADNVTLNADSGGTFSGNLTGTLNGSNFEVNGIDTGVLGFTNPAFTPGAFFDFYDGEDTYDGDGSFARLDIDMGDDNDTAMPGLGPEIINGGGQRGDWVSYASRTNAVDVSLNDSVTDEDDGERCTDDVTDLGAPLNACEGDDIFGFQILESGSGNDVLRGDFEEELFAPGAGDDTVNGEDDQGDGDVMSFFNCTGPITIDSATGSSTGGTCGTDTWTNIEYITGTDSGEASFDPTDGTVTGGDTITFAGETGGIDVDLENGPINGSSSLSDVCTHENDPVSPGDPAFWGETLGLCPHIENVIGSPGHDDIDGNEARNVLDGGAGDDEFYGDNGNDVLIGRAGNDDFNGGAGADLVWFGAAPNGVIVDLSLQFATGEGDDSFSNSGGGAADDVSVEIVFGSQFNDDITGGLTGFGSGTNFRMIGKAGDDNLTGADSNDTLLGGRGNDVMRGGDGLDTLKGAQGDNDWGFGGAGADFCARSTENRRSC